MDIVSRLKQFIDFTGLSSSQFADRALIPRPTLSQIMNGRNKKISNELITKLHIAFPELNVMWLMFGDGSMADASSMRFSKPQDGPNLFDSATQSVDNNQHSNATYPKSHNTEKTQDSLPFAETPQKTVSDKDKPITGRAFNASPFDAAQLAAGKFKETSTSEQNQSGDRKVNYVLVFFTDGSFQVLRPTDE